MGSSTRRRAVKFTDLELKLIGLLPKDGTPISTAEIVKLYPAASRQNVVGRLRGIADKSERCEELPWVLKRTPRAGPKGMSFWLAKKS